MGYTAQDAQQDAQAEREDVNPNVLKTEPTNTGYTQDQAKAEGNAETQPPVPPSPTTKPPKPFDLGAELNHTLAPYIQYAGNEFGIGVEGVHEGIVGAKAMATGNFNDAEKELAAGQAHAKAMEDTDQRFYDSRSAFDVFKYFGPAVRALPALGTTFGAGYAGAGAQAAAGAIAGTATGLAAAAPTGEVAAPITAPAGAAVGAAAGAGIGFNVSMFASATTLAGGASYMRYRRLGVSHKDAVIASTGIGLLNGALSVFRADKLLSAAKETIAKRIATGEFSKAFATGVGQFLKQAGVQGVIGGGVGLVNQLAQETADATIGALTNKAQMIPKFEDMITRIGKAMKDGAQVGAVLGAATHAGAEGIAMAVRHHNMPQTMKDLAYIAQHPVDGQGPEPTPPLPKPLEAKAVVERHARQTAKEARRDIGDQLMAVEVKIQDLHEHRSAYEEMMVEDEDVYDRIDAKLKQLYARRRDIRRKMVTENIGKLRAEHKKVADAKPALFETAAAKQEDLREAQRIHDERKGNIRILDAEINDNENLRSELELQHPDGVTNDNGLYERLHDQYKARRKLGEGLHKASAALEKARVKTDDAARELLLNENRLKQLKGQIDKRETKAAKQADEALAIQVERIKPKTVNGTKISQFDPTTDKQEILGAYAKYIKDPVLARDDLINGKGEYEIARDVLDALETTVGKEDLANALQDAIDDAKSEMSNRMLQLRAERKALIYDVREALAQGKPAKQLYIRADQFRQMVQEFAPGQFFSFQGKLRHALRGMSDEKAMEALVVRLNPRELVRDTESEKTARLHHAYNLIAEATGETKNQVVQRLRKGATTSIGDVHEINGKKETGIEYWHTNADGNVTRKLYQATLNQAAKTLMQMEDPELDAGFTEGNGFPTNMKRLITDALIEHDGSHVRQVIGVQKYYREAYAPLNKVFREQTGLDLPQNLKYSGYAKRIHGQRPSPQEEFEAGWATTNPHMLMVAGKPQHTKARVANSLPLDVHVDILDDLSKHISTSTQYEHWMAPSRQIFSPVFDDPVICADLDTKFGPLFRRSIQDHARYLITGRTEEQVIWASSINRILSKIAFAKLGLKPLMWAKHWAAMVTASQHMPIKDFFEGVTEYYTKPTGVFKFAGDSVASSSKQVALRNAHVMETFRGAAIPSKTMTNLEAGIMEVAMAPIKLGSQSAVNPIMYSAFRYFKKQGMTNAAAMLKAEEIVENTQVSGSPDILPNMSRSPSGKWFTMFHQQQIRFAEASMLGWERYATHGGADNFKAAMKISVISGIGIGIFPAVDAAFVSAISTNKHEKDEAWFKAALATTLGMIPGATLPVIDEATVMAGTVAKNTESKLLTGKSDNYHYFEPSVMPLDILRKTEKMLSDMSHMATNHPEGVAYWQALLQIGLDFADGPGTVFGMPLSPPIKVVKRLHKQSAQAAPPSSEQPTSMENNQ